ncbi:MAG: acetylxylan esterase [Phycisphaerales bacterium]
MIEPDDFGYSRVQTMAHIGDPAPSPNHGPFWKSMYTRIIEHRPVLALRSMVDDSDPTATHEFVSFNDVPIGCSLVLPSDGTSVRASLVTVHGYATPGPLADHIKRFQPIADTGVAVLIIRLRGYPGSQLVIGDQTAPDSLGAGWIARGFASERDEDWILPHAVADVVNACRVMRNALLERDISKDLRIPIDPQIDHPGVYLTGKSLGGGLATIAAAQLIGKLTGESIIDRLAIALPSLGDWNWRLTHAHSGTTAELAKVMTHHADREKELTDRLRLCDAVVHGRKVRVPTLGMLACKDDTAPAPSSAAVFNAIDADPGRKWRFTVPYGHFEGGIANARRHALFDRLLRDYFNPDTLPFQTMSVWEPLLHAGTHPPKGTP